MFATPEPLKKPDHLPEDNWAAIAAEEGRLHQSVESEDPAAIIGCLKSLVESVARVTKDLAGEPADVNASFDATVNRAHDLLRRQPGIDLTNDNDFSRVASQACKIASSLGTIRNAYGTGHGRARPPAVLDEMVHLSLDGGLMWVRWALRRLGPFTLGRPGPLIEDLHGGWFTSGSLAMRLQAADLPSLDPVHQRAVGVAVGQRVARDTFVVRWDGLDPARTSSELSPWTADYRQGVATGLLQDGDGQWTLAPRFVQWAVEVLEAVPDNSEWLEATVPAIVASTNRGLLSGDDAAEARATVARQATSRPEEEQSLWTSLAEHLGPPRGPAPHHQAVDS